jgi:hypothetical protein
MHLLRQADRTNLETEIGMNRNPVPMGGWQPLEVAEARPPEQGEWRSSAGLEAS